ncbi:polynucleotide adenylyltransferase [Helicobacter sp.]|uniref:polynucleotide adenylyltransferase n=1 Tax=Helicobacter sp. TaxID=218 RepID=UPI0025BD1526|nr:polynucleotide adenylyltransferase [Helicobacter sp.]MCI5632286.1 polynucleotide adenylyltransferase [Helicobacter sp.]MDY5556342.1 polynucleotide adenylyltransferase [Helicobacter sp.]
MANTDCIKKIYLVGGAVRDTLLGAPIKDKDYVAVGFSEADFAHLPKVGKKFPVFLQNDGSQLALARTEVKTAHGYNGFSVNVHQVSLYEDLKRRDLTINAIALEEETQTYYDPFDGIKDLKNKILRHISEAFCEDPLRVLRVARFRARLGIEWKIHASTKVLIYKMRDELLFLDKNRVYREVEMVFLGNNSYVFFNTLFELGVLDVIFPKIYALTTLKEGNLHHLESSVFAHTMEVLRIAELQLKALHQIPDNIESCDTQLELQIITKLAHKQFTLSQIAYLKKNLKWGLILKFAALYHDIAKPYCYRTFGNSQEHDHLHFVLPCLEIAMPNYIKKPMLTLIQNHIKIYKLQEMRPIKCITFFDSFKRDKYLFLLQLALLNADSKGRISSTPHTLELESLNVVFDTFNALKAYSPTQTNHKSIKEIILEEKAQIIKTHLNPHDSYGIPQ